MDENIEKSDQTQTNETAPDDRPESIRTNTRAEMEVVKTEKNFEVQIMHKDQHVEAIKYMSKKDIYEVFKILTVNLVLKKPNDPIRNMIDQLKEIQQEEKNNLESKNEQTNNST